MPRSTGSVRAVSPTATATVSATSPGSARGFRTCADSAWTRCGSAPGTRPRWRVRHRRLPRHRPDVRHPGGGRSPAVRGTRRRHPGDRRHRPQPLLGPAPLVHERLRLRLPGRRAGPRRGRGPPRGPPPGPGLLPDRRRGPRPGRLPGTPPVGRRGAGRAVLAAPSGRVGRPERARAERRPGLDARLPPPRPGAAIRPTSPSRRGIHLAAGPAGRTRLRPHRGRVLRTLPGELSGGPVPLPEHTEVLIAGGPVEGGALPPDTAVRLR